VTLDYLSHIGEETDRFVTAARKDLDSNVPSCPEWSVRDLSFHVWEAFSFWGQIVERRLTSLRDAVETERPSEHGLLDAITETANGLIETLSATEPSTPIWTWSANKTAGFVPRRMAHEISIHRWDCENATGEAAEIEADMAWDGVSEFFELFLLREGGEWSGDPATVRLVRTDTKESLDARSPGSAEEPRTTIAAPASDLMLAVWGRLPLSALDVEGDAGAFEKLMAASDHE
jgi:uncharacterized protein (TIGR03083 family)